MANKFRSYCKCGWPYIPDNRHVGQLGQIEDCKPRDNLEYLEDVLLRKEQQDETQRSKS